MADKQPTSFPPQEQHKQPGNEHEMDPEPKYMAEWYKGTGKLQDKAAIITGGDSGIGRSVAILFAREGCDVVISYLNETEDAKKTKLLVEKEGRRCELIPGDIGSQNHCNMIVGKTLKTFGKVDILINNAAEQHEKERVEEISEEQLEKTFRTNMFSQFFLCQAAIPHMKPGSCIINTTSINAFKGHKTLLDYTATKGAIASFTRSLATQLADKGIRVNEVAPGPIWTPLIPASFDKEHVKEFGKKTLMKRAGQPEEVAPSFVFLASRDSSYITGQTIHPNGGTIVGV